jgi:hypothetical protein
MAVPVLEYYLRHVMAALGDSNERSMSMSWAMEVRRSLAESPASAKLRYALNLLLCNSYCPDDVHMSRLSRIGRNLSILEQQMLTLRLWPHTAAAFKSGSGQ